MCILSILDYTYIVKQICMILILQIITCMYITKRVFLPTIFLSIHACATISTLLKIYDHYKHVCNYMYNTKIYSFRHIYIHIWHIYIYVYIYIRWAVNK